MWRADYKGPSSVSSSAAPTGSSCRAMLWVIVAFWVIAFLISLTQVRHLTFGDPTASTPLARREASPYNESHLEIQKFFGGMEPLIIVVEGRDKDILKDPQVLRTMEKFQRHLERDPDVGYSFSCRISCKPST